MGKFRRRRSEEEKDAPVGAMVSAALGLLGFLLAFTFGLASSRIDIRRELVVEEANAIGTADLRAELLPQPHRMRIHELLHEYLEVRLSLMHGASLEQVVQRSEHLHDLLWIETVAAGEKSPQLMTSLFIQALNEMIDVHSKRIAAGLNRIPVTIWFALAAVTILSMLGLGYQSGINNTHSAPAIFVLTLIFSAVIWLIADLDRSYEGLLTVSQQSLVDLQIKFKASANSFELKSK